MEVEWDREAGMESERTLSMMCSNACGMCIRIWIDV